LLGATEDEDDILRPNQPNQSFVLCGASMDAGASTDAGGSVKEPGAVSGKAWQMSPTTSHVVQRISNPPFLRQHDIL
jgi:hypothetical protein